MNRNFSRSITIFGIFAASIGMIGVLNAEENTGIIPEWVKNTANWWSEGQISETEYISSLQYLIDKKIIKVNTPITSVFASDASINEELRAHSFLVHIKNNNYGIDDTYYSFVQFFNRNEASGQPKGVLTGSPSSPEFVLGSLPSQDKKKLYEFVGKSIEPGGQIELLESIIDISVLDKNGEPINTWEYRDCILLDYVVYLDFEKDDYRWGELDDKEIRELFVFQCRGLDITA